LCFAVISDCIKHTSIETYFYNDTIIKYLMERFPISNLEIWSDGAAQHFKDFKTMALLSLYRQEYGLEHVEWNFQVNVLDLVHNFKLYTFRSKYILWQDVCV
jgi:hypothetical protein